MTFLSRLQSRHPRPNFELISSQPPVGPFILDSSCGIQVNPAINQWLRDYQREGVQFFYDRYKEGRGGILGDDMGLGQFNDHVSGIPFFILKVRENHSSYCIFVCDHEQDGR